MVCVVQSLKTNPTHGQVEGVVIVPGSIHPSVSTPLGLCWHSVSSHAHCGYYVLHGQHMVLALKKWRCELDKEASRQLPCMWATPYDCLWYDILTDAWQTTSQARKPAAPCTLTSGCQTSCST